MKKTMTLYQHLFLTLVVFFSCFGGAYLFLRDWQFQHVFFWYLFCLIVQILILFKRGSDE